MCLINFIGLSSITWFKSLALSLSVCCSVK
jgi:hypothetical protein